MDHRYSRRFATRVVTVIHHHSVPVAIGVVLNCNRTGVYIETCYRPADHEHCLDFELALNRNGRTWRQALRGLIVHRDEHGLGLLIEDAEFTAVVEALRPQTPLDHRADGGVALPFH